VAAGSSDPRGEHKYTLGEDHMQLCCFVRLRCHTAMNYFVIVQPVDVRVA
jgi:hypothetical protein